MKEHGFIAFPAGVSFHKPGATALDLDLAAGTLLDMFHVCAALSDNLSAKVETRDWLQIDRDALFGPFTLDTVSPRFGHFC
jgi:hypothetical protein